MMMIGKPEGERQRVAFLARQARLADEVLEEARGHDFRRRRANRGEAFAMR